MDFILPTKGSETVVEGISAANPFLAYTFQIFPEYQGQYSIFCQEHIVCKAYCILGKCKKYENSNKHSLQQKSRHALDPKISVEIIKLFLNQI